MNIKEFFYLPWWYFRSVVLGKKAPLQSVVFISDKCNLSCKHCSVYNHTSPVTKTMSQIRGELEYCYRLGSRFVDFEGGEPFLWRDGDKTVDDLCDLAREIGFFSCTITTNAQQNFRGSRADSIWISMDGVGDFHEQIRGAGTWKRLLENAASCGHKALAANMVVNNLNRSCIREAAEFVKNNPAFQCISFNMHTPFPGTEYLALDETARQEVIEQIIALKKEGFPIMNSVSGLRRMKDMNFRHCCWMTNFVFMDGSREPQCIGPKVGNCPRCGFCMAGEEWAVVHFCPDTLLAGLKLRAFV